MDFNFFLCIHAQLLRPVKCMHGSFSSNLESKKPAHWQRILIMQLYLVHMHGMHPNISLAPVSIIFLLPLLAIISFHSYLKAKGIYISLQDFVRMCSCFSTGIMKLRTWVFYVMGHVKFCYHEIFLLFFRK